MKKMLLAAILAVMTLPLLGRAQTSGNIPSLAKEIDTKMTRAIESLEAGRVPEGSLLLLDVVLLTRPKDDWPAGFGDALESARASFVKSDFSRAVRSTKQAIRILDPGSTEPGKGIRERTANVAELFRNRIQRARERFKNGQADRGVLLILEAFSLIAPEAK